MKKAITVLLAVLLAMSLAACSNDGNEANQPADSAPTGNEANQPADTTPADDSQASFEPMELVYITIHDENSSSAVFDKYFTEYITEATNGAVTWNIFWSGTAASAREELDMLKNGVADVAALNVLPYANQLTLTQWPRYTCNSYEGTAEYGKYLLFENEETASMIQDNFEENGVHTLGFGLIGNEGYFCRKDVKDIQSMKGMLFGTGTAGALETEYGMNVVFTIGTECYDSLQRGVIDVAGLGLGSAYDYCLYEVAPYWVFYNRVGLNSFYSINLSKWNSFSPELQSVFEEAGRTMVDFYIEYYEESEGKIQEEVEAQGVTVVFNDDAEYAETDFMINAENALATAQSNGKLDSMKVIIQAGADKLGYDVSDLLAKY